MHKLFFSSNWSVIFFFRYNFGHPSHRVLCLFGTNVLPFTCQICMYCPFKNIWALGFSYLWRCWKVSCWILYDWLYDGELVLLPLTYLLKRSRQAVFSESITFFILDANWETECLNLKLFFKFYRVLVLHFLPSLATWYLRLFLTSLTGRKIFQSLKPN